MRSFIILVALAYVAISVSGAPADASVAEVWQDRSAASAAAAEDRYGNGSVVCTSHDDCYMDDDDICISGICSAPMAIPDIRYVQKQKGGRYVDGMPIKGQYIENKLWAGNIYGNTFDFNAYDYTGLGHPGINIM